MMYSFEICKNFSNGNINLKKKYTLLKRKKNAFKYIRFSKVLLRTRSLPTLGNNLFICSLLLSCFLCSLQYILIKNNLLICGFLLIPGRRIVLRVAVSRSEPTKFYSPFFLLIILKPCKGCSGKKQVSTGAWVPVPATRSASILPTISPLATSVMVQKNQ